MPHSSGGGSHSGGSHSSGSHSSGGGSHSGGSRSSTRRSNTPFAGSRRYMYYDRHHVVHYYYSNQSPSDSSSKLRYFILLFYIPFILVVLNMMFASVHYPSKLKADFTGIVIQDELGVLSDGKDELATALVDFQAKTGIMPAVITCKNSDWQQDTSLERYAFSAYVNNFSDENHWLIVYSEPEQSASGYVDWCWEGMQGDNTDNIITTKICDDFGYSMDRYLSADTRYSVAEAIAASFNDTTAVCMNLHIQWETLGIAVVILIFLIVHGMLMSGLNPWEMKYRKAVPAPIPHDAKVCNYCGTVYNDTDKVNCDNCGAVLVTQDSIGIKETK